MTTGYDEPATPQVNMPAGMKDLAQDDIQELVRRSVVQGEGTPANGAGGLPGGLSTIFMLAQTADKIPRWGTNPYLRDVRLRQFFGQEAFSTSAISTLVARNMGFGWRTRGDEGKAAADDQSQPGNAGGETDLVEYCRRTLNSSSDQSRGWQHMISSLSLDLYTQDRSAVMEIVRDVDAPFGKWIGCNHLDSLRCWHTGNWQFPVLYMGKDGKWAKLPWYRVAVISELPATHETAYGLQYSALTRILTVAQVFRNTLQYMSEKTSGNFSNAIHVMSGVTAKEIEDAIKVRKFQNENEGVLSGLIPAILATLDPTKDPKLVTLELATLPADWKLDEIWKWFTVIVAMGLWSDYGDFAPLPGNNLGSAAQSQTMYERSKGKGAAVFRELVEFTLNEKVMPEGVTFEFWVNDPAADKAEAETSLARAQARGAMVTNGEIDAAASRKLALAAGDITQEIFDEMELRAEEQAQLEEQQRQEELQLMTAAMAGNEGNAAPQRPIPFRRPAAATKAQTLPYVTLDERLAYEDEVEAKIRPALAKAGDLVKRKLRKLG